MQVIDQLIDKPTKRVPKDKALKDRLNGLTYQEIADKYGVSKQAINQALSSIINMASDSDALEKYEKGKSSILSAVESKVLLNLSRDDVLQKASCNNLAYALQAVNNINRLHRGLSTSNVSVQDTQSQLSDRRSRIQAINEQLKQLDSSTNHGDSTPDTSDIPA